MPQKKTCSYCACNHSYEECPNKAKTPKCANCGLQHSAAYRSCPVYKETKAALKLRSSHNLTFKEAVKQVRQQAENKAIPGSVQLNVAIPEPSESSNKPVTSTPTVSETEFKRPLPRYAIHKASYAAVTAAVSVPKPTPPTSHCCAHCNAHTDVLGTVAEAISYFIDFYSRSVKNDDNKLAAKYAAALQAAVSKLKPLTTGSQP